MPEEFDDRSLDVPESLASELRSAYGAAPRVSADVDRFVLSAARANLARTGRLRIWLRAGGAVAAAAVIVIAVGLYTRMTPEAARRAPVVAQHITRKSSLDLNADGKVDILDALRAAHEHQSKDQIDAIAMAAVSVTPAKEATP